jgi:hypothetical protein
MNSNLLMVKNYQSRAPVASLIQVIVLALAQVGVLVHVLLRGLPLAQEEGVLEGEDRVLLGKGLFSI